MVPPPSSNPNFPPRPKPRDHDYENKCKAQGLPKFQHKLLDARNQGLYYLAVAILDIHYTQRDWQASIFSSGDDILPQIISVLASMHPTMITTIIKNRFQLFFKGQNAKGFKLPSQYQEPILPAVNDMDEERPIIYTLGVSDLKGNVPSIEQIREALDYMERYAEVHVNAVDWKTADDEAADIDNLPSNVDRDKSGRTWVPSVKQSNYWKIDDAGNPIPHHRRYCRKEKHRKLINTFVDIMRRRLQSIQGAAPTSCPPWSIVDVGWSYKPYLRRKNHYSHDGYDHIIKNLFETCLQLAVPKADMFTRMVLTVNVLDPPHAATAEHAISILWGAYARWGGLIASLAGSGIEASSRKLCSDKSWLTAAKSLLNQGVFDENLKKLRKRLEMDEFLEKYKDNDSEVKDVEAAQVLLTKGMDDLTAAKQIVKSRYQDIILSKKDKFARQMKVVESSCALNALYKLNIGMLAVKRAKERQVKGSIVVIDD